MKIWLVVASVIVSVLPCAAAKPSVWGWIDSGLRLGLAIDPIKDDVHLFLENTSPADLRVVVGWESAAGLAYGFTFSATGRDGANYEISDVEPATMKPGTGLVLPKVVTIASGTTWQGIIPMRNLTYMGQHGDVPLRTLLDQGCTLTASLAVRREHLGAIRRQPNDHLWLGEVKCSLP